MSRSSAFKRFMIFFDGSNLVNALGRRLGVSLDEGRPTAEVFAVAKSVREYILQIGPTPIERSCTEVVRSYWVGSVHGTDGDREGVSDLAKLRDLEPVLLPKRRGDPEKGVDMTLAVTMLAHAFQGNFDTAVLVAGDGDYVRLVEEVKRYGARVIVASFESGLSPSLRRSADRLLPLDEANVVSAAIRALKESAGKAQGATPRPKAGRIDAAIKEYVGAREQGRERQEQALTGLEQTIAEEIGLNVKISRSAVS